MRHFPLRTISPIFLSMSEPLRLGFVGVGKQAQCAHIRHYATLPDCELVAVADPDIDLAGRVASRFGIPRVYATHTELMASEKIDAIITTLPPISAAEHLIIDILNAGIPVFVEKPLAGSPLGSERIVEAVAKTGTLLKVGFHKRSDPATIAAKQEIDRLKETGELGKMTYARMHVNLAGDWIAGGYKDALTGTPPPRTPPVIEDFPGMDEEARTLCSQFAPVHGHQFDLMSHLVGEPLLLAYAEPSKVLLVTQTASHVPTVFEFTPYESKSEWIERALVCFERGYVSLDLPPPLAMQRAGTVEIFYEASGTEAPKRVAPLFPSTCALENQAQLFLDAVRGKTTPLCNAAAAHESILLSKAWGISLSAMKHG